LRHAICVPKKRRNLAEKAISAAFFQVYMKNLFTLRRGGRADEGKNISITQKSAHRNMINCAMYDVGQGVGTCLFKKY
jgi:hypothetical protein